MVLDRFHYGVHFPVSKWVAAALVVVLLGYLLADSGSGRQSRRIPAITRAATVRSSIRQPGEVPSALHGSVLHTVGAADVYDA